MKSKIVSAIGCAATVLLIIIITVLALHQNGKEEYDIVFFGDSIIAGVYNEYTVPAMLEQKTGLKTLNAAYGGCGMSNIALAHLAGDYNAFYSMDALSESVRVRDFSLQIMSAQKENPLIDDNWYITACKLNNVDWDRVKFIVVEHGINDYLFGMPVEDPDDSYNEHSFAGALRTSIENIRKGAPNAVLVLSSPIYANPDGMQGDCETADYGGGLLRDYLAKEREIAAEYGVYLIDNYHEVGINRDNFQMYLGDGLHGTVEGNDLISENIARHINLLYTELN